jgi:hypothetical protein
MRARAESLGGTFDAGPLPKGGFLVAAVLPTPAFTPAPPVALTPESAPAPETASVEEKA